jgi:hypothetical protein
VNRGALVSDTRSDAFHEAADLESELEDVIDEHFQE